MRYEKESKTCTETMWQGACEVATAPCCPADCNDDVAPLYVMLACISGCCLPASCLLGCVVGRFIPVVGAAACTPVTCILDAGIWGAKKTADCCCPTDQKLQPLTQHMI